MCACARSDLNISLLNLTTKVVLILTWSPKALVIPLDLMSVSGLLDFSQYLCNSH